MQVEEELLLLHLVLKMVLEEMKEVALRLLVLVMLGLIILVVEEEPEDVLHQILEERVVLVLL